jgi:hypothetical protein
MYSKNAVCLIIAYFYSSTELEKKRRTGSAWKPAGRGGEGGGGGQGGEMTQTMYAHVNK